VQGPKGQQAHALTVTFTPERELEAEPSGQANKEGRLRTPQFRANLMSIQERAPQF